VLIDGHSVAFRSTAANFLGPELIPMSVIERVEIIRGPASALYGADAFLAVINVVTRDGAKLDGGDLSVHAYDAGASMTGGTDVALGGKSGAVSYIVAYQRAVRDVSGFRLPDRSPRLSLPRYATPDSVANGLMQSSEVAFGKVDVNLGRVQVVLDGYYSAIDREAAFSPWLQLGYGIDQTGRLNENHVSLAHGHVGAKVVVDLSACATLTSDNELFHGQPTARDRLDVGSDTYFVERRLAFTGVDSTLELRWSGIPKLDTIAGLGLVVDDETLPSIDSVLKHDAGDLRAGDVIEEISTRQGNRLFVNPAAYLLAVWTPLGKRLGLTTGARYDYHNVYGSRVSGRIGLVSSLRGDKVNLKLMYGNAHKAPSPLLLYGVPLTPGDVIGNAKLQAQVVHTVEGRAAYKPFKYGSVETGLTTSAIIDKAEFVQQGLNRIARNQARLLSVSWDLEVKAQPRSWLQSYARLELNRTMRSLGDDGYLGQLVGSRGAVYPEAQAHFGVFAGSLASHLRGGADVAIVGRRRATDDNILEAGTPYYLPRYVTLGASLSTAGLKLIGDHETTFSVTARNLTGSQFAEPGFGGVDYPALGRVIMVRIDQRL
jgi:outer membrane receptor for ferrienterochelin and colicins